MIRYVLKGDCLAQMRQIPNNSVDMILCDLPYGTTACKWDVVIPFDELWRQYKRLIKDTGVIVLTASQPFTSALVMSNPEWFRYEWIWNKNKGSNIVLANKQPLKVHENILVFSKNQPPYFPQKTEGMPYKQRGSHNKNRTDSTMPLPIQIKYSKNHDTSKRLPISIQYFPNHREKEEILHPTQKPIALFEYLIKTYTNEGDLVLDNCAGSGTTGVACYNTNRQFILIENDEEYIDIINKRLTCRT